MKETEKTPKELRKFGLTMALICIIFSAIGVWKNGTITGLALVLFIFASVFTFLAALVPTILRDFEKFWMILGEKINKVITPIILSITYYAMIAPIGLILRLLGKDVLELKIDKNRNSYWEKIDQSGSASRHNTPY